MSKRPDILLVVGATGIIATVAIASPTPVATVAAVVGVTAAVCQDRRRGD